MTVRPALMPDEITLVRHLFQEYQDGLEISLCFQDFEAELAGLPGGYAPPGGCLLLAFSENQPAGCVAVRPIDPPGTCELKRLYVRPAYRGAGLGRELIRSAIDQARSSGHVRMRLDTLSNMTEALALYRSLGFREIEPYGHHPVAGTLFLEVALV